MAALPRSVPRRPSRPVARLRRSLAACTAEGTAAEVVGACCGGAALTGWALHLGMGAKLVGLVVAMPVAAQVVQLAGAFLTARFGHRRTALVAVALSRQAFLPLALLPLWPLSADGRRTLLLVAAAAHHGLGLVANNAWNAWMGELVPRRLRGRYFGRRTALCTVAGGLAALAVGVALDHGGETGRAGPVLQVLALAASLSGALSVSFMARQYARPAGPPRPLADGVRAMVRPLLDPRARRIVLYAATWNAACGLSAPFFGLYLLRDLRTGYALLAAQGAGLAAAKIASSGAWGRAVDRLGPRRVLVACTAGLAVSPVAWIACGPGRVWPLAIETAVGGVLLGGHALASFALPLSVAPQRERPFYLGVVAAAGGAAFAATSALGGAFADTFAADAPLRLVLAGSALLRAAAVAAALGLPGDPRLELAASNDAAAARLRDAA